MAWTNNDPGAARLRLDRSKDYGQTFQTIAFVAPAADSYIDSYVAPGQTYVYRVSAENAEGISGPTNTVTVVGPAAAGGEQGAIPPPDNTIPTDLTDQWVGNVYADGEYASGGTKTAIAIRLNIDAAAAKIQQDKYTDQITVLPEPDGKHGVFHTYGKDKEGGPIYLGSYIFDATDANDIAAKLKQAENGAAHNTIITAANTAMQIVECGIQVAVAVIPGPDDLLIGAFVQQAITKFAAQGTKATYQFGKWVFTKAGAVLTGEAAKKETAAFRTVVIGELEQVTWAPGIQTLSSQYAKHIPKSNAWTRAIIQATKGKTALYKPGQDIEMLERSVWQSGTPVTNGKNWKVYEFDHVIGASEGKEVRWVRVEGTGGPGNTVIHGHPITQQEYRNLTK